MTERTLLVLTAPGAVGQRSALTAAAEEAGRTARFVSSAGEARSLIEKEAPSVLLVDASAAGAEAACQKVRGNANLCNLPIIAYERKLSDRAFTKVFRWGADDLISLETTADLVRRIKGLPDRDAAGGPPSVRGEVLVADPDETRRSAVARVLVNAGYVVTQAADRKACEAALARPLRVAAVATTLGTPGLTDHEVRQRSASTVFIWTARTSELDRVAETIGALERVAVVDALDPPENVLFLANELQGAHGNESRRDPRMLYGAMVGFRGAGSSKDDFGFTYNVSAHGLFVRTLAPPPDDRVWLELRAPSGSRRARFDGRIAWRRPFGPNDRATAPAGWGVEIASMLASDADIWIEGCADLARIFAKRSMSPPARPSSQAPPAPESSRPPPKIDGASSIDRPVAVVAAATVEPLAPGASPAAARTAKPNRATLIGHAVPDALLAAVAPSVPIAQAIADALEAPTRTPDPPRLAPDALAPSVSDPIAPDPIAPAPAAPIAVAPAPALVSAPDAPTPAPFAPYPAPEIAVAPTERPPATPAFAHAPVVSVSGASDAALASFHSPPYADPAGSGWPSNASVVRKSSASQVGLALAIGGVVVILVGAAAVWAFALRSTASPGVPPEASSTTSAPAQPPVSPSTATEPVTAPSIGAPPAAPSPSAESSASRAEGVAADAALPPAGASASVGATPASPAPPGAAPAPPGDPAQLNWSKGYLYVRSAAALDVYSHAHFSGTTNAWLEVKCGLRWVRLSEPGGTARAEGPTWKGAGQTVDVTCQGATTVTMGE